ncbi:YqgQ family protein [Salinicoccus albus]|uniref:YqgQ family protein n=1 Tax=Salinicoccus albus TaxID=418756 RepID=UPI00037DDCBA|nr:YqgQ family protein [Salinicoccus albus]
MVNDDLTYVNELLRRFGIYVYDKDMKNRLSLMEMEIRELYKYELLTKEEFTRAIWIIRKRG